VPFPLAKTITSWSISRYGVYEQCPAKARYKFIDKLKEPEAEPGSPMHRGSEIHKEAEFYVKGESGRLPKSLSSLGSEFKALRAARKANPALVTVEETWSFRKDWSITTWNDWNGCWLRVKLDVADRDGPNVRVSDVKTGKYWTDNVEDYKLQLEIYSTAALIMYSGIPDVRVTARLLYVDEGTIYPEEPTVYTAKDLPALKKTWEKRTKPMLTDKTFAPKPNRFCKWCHYRKENSGPCKF